MISGYAVRQERISAPYRKRCVRYPKEQPNIYSTKKVLKQKFYHEKNFSKY